MPAGTSGAISVFASDETDLVIDINGYFGKPGTSGLDLFTVAPCRVRDTRNEGSPFNGTIVTNVAANGCMPQGANAGALRPELHCGPAWSARMADSLAGWAHAACGLDTERAGRSRHIEHGDRAFDERLD